MCLLKLEFSLDICQIYIGVGLLDHIVNFKDPPSFPCLVLFFFFLTKVKKVLRFALFLLGFGTCGTVYLKVREDNMTGANTLDLGVSETSKKMPSSPLITSVTSGNVYNVPEPYFSPLRWGLAIYPLRILGERYRCPAQCSGFTKSTKTGSSFTVAEIETFR